MAGFVEYHLTSAGRGEFVGYSAYLDYRLPDGSTLPVEQQPAWCPSCKHFVLAGRVPDDEELERRLAEAQAAAPEAVARLGLLGRSPEEEVAELTRRVAWRRGRVSPPRCLHCGSGRVAALPDGDEFPHPETGERVVVTGSGFADMEPWVAEFSPEGVEAPKEDAGG